MARGVVTIKQYRQRSNPSGPARGKARAADFGDGSIAAALGGVAEGVKDYAAMRERGEQVDFQIERIKTAREEDDARAYSARAIADATSRYAAAAREVEAEAPDGWRGLTENSVSAWEGIDQDILSHTPEGPAQQFVSQHLGVLRSEMATRQATRENDLRRSWRLDDIDRTASTWESVLVQDPTQYGRASSSMRETIGSLTDITADDRRDRLAANEERLSFFTVSGMVERDPAGTLALLQGGQGGSAETMGPQIADLFGAQLTSGRRTAERNAAVGGVENSLHLSGSAVDISPPAEFAGMSREQIEAAARADLAERFPGVNFSEVIWEDDHLHVGWEGGGEAPAADGPFAALSAEGRVALTNRAQAEISRQGSVASAAVREQVQSTLGLLERGEQPVNPPSVEIVRATQGERAAADYEVALQTFSARSTMNEMTSEDLVRLATEAPLESGTSVERLDNAVRRTAAAQILQQRDADPMGYAVAQGLVSDTSEMMGAIGSGNFADVGARLRRRVGVALEQNRRLGTAPAPFTAPEAAALRGQLDRLDPNGRVLVLQNMRAEAAMPRRGDGGSYAAMVGQIYGDNPGAYAGALVANRRASIAADAGRIDGPTAARRMMAGAALLNPPGVDTNANGQTERQRSTFNMPSNAALEGAFQAYVGDAYTGAPRAYERAFQAFRSYYAGAASETGINAAGLTFTSDGRGGGVVGGDEAAARLADEATRVAVGNLRLNESGGAPGLPQRVYLPWGMDEDLFHDSLEQGWGAVRERFPEAELGEDPRDYDYALDGDGWYRVFYQGVALPDGDGDFVRVRPRLSQR